MQELDVKLRKWGRSFGVVIPKETVNGEKFKEGDDMKIIITRKTNVLRETFGTLKFKRSTDEILKEVDEEGWDE